MATRAHVVGWGKYLPKRILTNDELAQIVDTSDEWIRTRTGILERRIADDGESTATMATEAARRALEVANLSPSQLDLIVVASMTPDHTFPATACLVQDALGARRAGAFDLSAGCSGFVYGLSLAADLIASGAYRNILVVGSDTPSRVTDWSDRATCVLFGDGAGAVVLQANGLEGGILSTVLGADGSGGHLLQQPAGGSREPASHRTVAEKLHFLQMKGREVFRFAIKAMPGATRAALEKAGLQTGDIDLIIPHQANTRIIESSIKTLGLADDMVFSNLEQYGNTCAASIPIAMCEAVEQGRLQPDDLVVCVGFGAGLTWGAAALRWSVPLPTEPLTPLRRAWQSLRYRYAGLRSLVRRFVRWLLAHFVKE